MTTSPKKDRPPFILASGSPRREKLLRLFDIPFRVDVSSVAEKIDHAIGPQKIVQQLALRKARDVAGRHPRAVLLGADTIVEHQGNILEKPENADQAIQMLQKLSNSTHTVFSGVALVKTEHQEIIAEHTFYESTNVIFGDLDQEAIENYVAGGSPMDKAGAYGIQDDWGAIFVKGIEGDYYNIVGLPLHTLYKNLRNFAPHLF